MKIALSIGLTALVLVLLFIKKLKPHRGKIMLFYALSLAALFAFYNLRTADYILPFYRPVNQMFYQPEFLEEGLYPDAVLPYILKGKTIHVTDFGMDTDGDLNSFEAWSEGRIFIKDFFNILEENGARLDFEALKNSDIDVLELSAEETEDLCADFGAMNDTFRYSYFFNNLDSEYGNGFYYYWFYAVSKPPFYLYVDPKGLTEATDLYIAVDENANLVLLSEEEYLREEENKND